MYTWSYNKCKALNFSVEEEFLSALQFDTILHTTAMCPNDLAIELYCKVCAYPKKC